MGNATSAEPITHPVPDFLNKKQIGEWILGAPITGFKQITCKCRNGKYEYFTAQVTVPRGAFVIRPEIDGRYVPSDKLRTNEYKIEKIFQNLFFEEPVECFSNHDPGFKYKEGETYKVDYDRNLSRECTRGLHFFLTKKEADDY